MAPIWLLTQAFPTPDQVLVPPPKNNPPHKVLNQPSRIKASLVGTIFGTGLTLWCYWWTIHTLVKTPSFLATGLNISWYRSPSVLLAMVKYGVTVFMLLYWIMLLGTYCWAPWGQGPHKYQDGGRSLTIEMTMNFLADFWKILKLVVLRFCFPFQTIYS